MIFNNFSKSRWRLFLRILLILLPTLVCRDYQHHGVAAEEVFGELLKHYLTHAAGMHMMGVTLMQQKRFPEAIVFLEKSIARHSGHAGWYHNAMLGYRALGRTEDAEKMLVLGKTKISFEESLLV